MSRCKVVVLGGGPDAERQVSIMSATAVAAALRAASGSFDVRYLEIDRLTPSTLADIEADVFFPALHGPWGEGGPLQRLLEEHDRRPFVGSGSEAAEIAMDKMRCKTLARRIGVTTPAACQLASHNDLCSVSLPLVVKPIDDGSSVDVRICRTEGQLSAARADLMQRRSRIMAERYIPGRELTVGIVGDEVDSIIEITTNVPFYDYQAKYERDDTQYEVDPDLPAELRTLLREWSLRIFRHIGCRDVARVDFRFDPDRPVPEGGLHFLEINTMPGFTSHSLVPMGSAARGVAMAELCAHLVNCALERGHVARKETTTRTDLQTVGIARPEL